MSLDTKASPGACPRSVAVALGEGGGHRRRSRGVWPAPEESARGVSFGQAGSFPAILPKTVDNRNT